MKLIKNRLPVKQEIQSIFGFLVFSIFTWSVRGFLYKLPSFMLYYSTDEIIGIFFYMMSFALLESLTLMGAILLVTLVTPIRFFESGFVYKWCVVLMVVWGYLIYLQSSLTFRLPSPKEAALGVLMAIAILIATWLFTQRFERLRKIIESIMDRFSVFLFIYIPLGVIGVFVVIVRNILQ